MKAKFFRGQSILEYTLIVAIVSAALITMQLYFKRGVQSAIKTAADQMGPQQAGELIDAGEGLLSETSSQDISTASSKTETLQEAGGVKQRTFSYTSTSSGSAVSTIEQED